VVNRIGNAHASAGSTRVDRAGFLRRGGALAVGSSAVALLAAAPALAAALPDADAASLRLLIGCELLALDFQARALASAKLGSRSAALLGRMRSDELAHYRALADLLGRAGQVAATADDIDFSYPPRTFAGERSILKLADELEALQVGAYVGAGETLQAPQLRLAISQIAANEAQHGAALAALAGRAVIGRPFAPALPAAAVSATLDAYES